MSIEEINFEPYTILTVYQANKALIEANRESIFRLKAEIIEASHLDNQMVLQGIRLKALMSDEEKETLDV